MRGIPKELIDALQAEGITPVYAGNTNASAYLLHQREDHPRLCGEYIFFLKIRKKIEGSPPSMRGIQGEQ